MKWNYSVAANASRQIALKKTVFCPRTGWRACGSRRRETDKSLSWSNGNFKGSSGYRSLPRY